jgi:hypothetical protein
VIAWGQMCFGLSMVSSLSPPPPPPPPPPFMSYGSQTMKNNCYMWGHVCKRASEVWTLLPVSPHPQCFLAGLLITEIILFWLSISLGVEEQLRINGCTDYGNWNCSFFVYGCAWQHSKCLSLQDYTETYPLFTRESSSFHSFISNLSYDRSTASSKTIPTLNAI